MRKATRLLTLTVAVATASLALAAQRYEVAALERFRTEYEASLKTDTGWLTVAGLHFLNQGENTVGRAPTNDIVLDFPGVPNHAAVVMLEGDRTRVKAAPGGTVMVNGQPVREAPLTRSGLGKPVDAVSFGRVPRRAQRRVILFFWPMRASS